MNLQLQRTSLNRGGMPEYLTRGISPWQRAERNLPQTGRSQNAVVAYSKPATARISIRLKEAIERSRYILDLEDDWDEEGSPGFQETTWKRATDFILQVAISFRQQPHGFWIEPPRILPGPKGSLDIHWKTSKRELLINVPENMSEPADYYGSGGRTDIIKGKLETSAKNEWILTWLTR
ncbi:MAG: hypothetical protein JST84_10880 [Acidobacteria bacterium]|nr:hypothetical protein [Acidobacteriota bacterium]